MIHPISPAVHTRMHSAVQSNLTSLSEICGQDSCVYVLVSTKSLLENQSFEAQFATYKYEYSLIPLQCP